MPRNKAELPQASDAEYEAAKAMYEREAKNWPSPVGWDNLLEGSKFQWVLRVRQQGRHR